MNVLKLEKQEQVIAMLVDGCSIRAIERITNVNRNTIMRLLVRSGDHCSNLHNIKVRELRCTSVEADEIWCFVAKKDGHVISGVDPPEYGDTYTFIGMDMDTKLIISCLVGKRDDIHTHRFISDLSRRVKGRIQLTTDGWVSYQDAVDRYLGGRVDYMQVIKTLYPGRPSQTGVDRRYSPPKTQFMNKKWMAGTPRDHLASTSHVERLNLTVRMQLRRFTRLTNGFSRKLVNLKSAVSMFVMWYNFVKIHSSLGMTPAMAHGVTDRIWNRKELIRSSGR